MDDPATSTACPTNVDAWTWAAVLFWPARDCSVVFNCSMPLTVLICAI